MGPAGRGHECEGARIYRLLIENSVHAAEQYGAVGSEQGVAELAHRCVQAAEGQGISEAEMQVEIGEVADYIRGKLKAANKAESDRLGPN